MGKTEITKLPNYYGYKHCQNCNESHVKMNYTLQHLGAVPPRPPALVIVIPPFSFFWIRHWLDTLSNVLLATRILYVCPPSTYRFN